MTWRSDPRDIAGWPADEPAAGGPDRSPRGAPERAARYRRWDGSQAGPDLTAEELLDALAQDLIERGDVAAALRDLLQRGVEPGEPDARAPKGGMEAGSGLRGLADLRDELDRRRGELLGEHQVDDVLGEVRRELDEIVGRERAGVERRLAEAIQADDVEAAPGAASHAAPGDERSASGKEPAASGTGRPAESGSAGPGSIDQRDAGPGARPSDGGPDGDRARWANLAGRLAAQRRAALDALPDDPGGRIRALQAYDFLELEARERFERLVAGLRQQVMARAAEGLGAMLAGLSPDDLAGSRSLVRELNQLLEAQLAGGHPDPSGFMARHASRFPGALGLDDVVARLGAEQRAVRSLLRSVPDEERRELESLVDALLRDDRLRADVARLRSNLDRILPDDDADGLPFAGDEPLELAAALDRIDELHALDDLQRALEEVATAEDLAGIDRELLRDLLGDRAVEALDALDRAARHLEASGLVSRSGDRLELTPLGSRRIGQAVLADLFSSLDRDAFGGHRIDRTGRGGERDGEVTKRYDYGDPFAPDLRATLFNALARPENAPGGRAGASIRLAPEDFEVYRTEQLTSTSTVLLLDMSRSMLLRGCYVAAKKVAIALDALIRAQYPRDYLGVVGFAASAREIRPERLAELTWHGYEYGTNLQHGLQLARRMLARRHASNREIIVITDGEPTAHFEDGRVAFSYPPTQRTIQETMREVGRCTRDGITINTFMLEESRPLAAFVERIARLNRGRAFYAAPERLGRYVLVDFVAHRTRRIG